MVKESYGGQSTRMLGIGAMMKNRSSNQKPIPLELIKENENEIHINFLIELPREIRIGNVLKRGVACLFFF
jgi:hypothetical protein